MTSAVMHLYHDLMPLAEKHDFLVSSPKTFGLEIDVFDPHTGVLFSAARPHRRDVGLSAIQLTAAEVLDTVLSVRRHVHNTGG